MNTMSTGKNLYGRRSIRLQAYDYSAGGAYYVTMCTQNRRYLFCDVKNGAPILNDVGRMVSNCWEQLSQRFPNVKTDKFIVMPNHLHGIIWIMRAPIKGAPTVGEIVGAYKSITTNEYIRNVKNNSWQPFDKRVWQRNYYERVIRNESELYFLRQYIANNLAEWDSDPERLV